MVMSLRVILLAVLLFGSAVSYADPISPTPRYTFAGNVDFTATAATLRTESNSGDSCAVGTSASASLTGVPIGADIEAAYLYWAGSGSTPDLNVTFGGSSLTASRSFSENYTTGSTSLDYFSGFADVTGQVAGNGTYTLSGLSVTSTGTHCSVSAVVGGWGLIVVYSHASNPFRVINVFDGFQSFRGSSIALSPSNFVIPPAPIDGKLGVLTWEGDVENSATLGGVSENIIFDGQSTAPVNLTDGLNPVNNQYNSTINLLGSSTSYGVDLDVYDISSRLASGDTSAQTNYSSGGDLVILSAQVISVTNAPVADLSIVKSHVGDFGAGNTNSFQIDVTNSGPAAEPGPVVVTDTLAAGLSYAGFSSVDANWGCLAAGQDVTCTYTGSLGVGASLATLDLLVDVDVSAVPSVDNTATVSGSLFDPFSANSSDTDSATVLVPDLTTPTKTVLPVSGYPVLAGDVLRYTITINESAGVPVSGVSVTDVLDGLLTNLNVIDAGGGTDNSVGTTLQIDDLTIPASGSVEVVFETEVAGGASTGDSIPNSADITNPVDTSVSSADAPDVTVGNVPTNGVKPLYMGDIGGSQNSPVLPLALSRTPIAGLSSPVRVRIRRQDDDRVWAMTPALQSDLDLDGSTMPVHLHMRRNGQTSARDIRVTLSYQVGAATTLIGCQDLTLNTSGAGALVNNETREFVFNVGRTNSSCTSIGASAFTIPAGAQILVQVDNDPTGNSGRAVFVYPVSDLDGGRSRVELPATSVINVASTQFFDAAYSGGTVQTGFTPGQTVFVRTVVSDPFGSFDISSVDYQILDPSSNPVATGTMTQVFDSGAATATYEVAYPIGIAPVAGLYTAIISAHEGSEGTVTHTANFSFNVLVSQVTLEKFVSVASDPVTATTNPKAIPLSILEYVIRATNGNGIGDTVDTVVIVDSLPSDVLLNFSAGFGFTDGSPSSGLTFSYGGPGDASDDVRFSNDGGGSFISPSVDGFGFDATLPPINYIEFAPQGTFAPDTGGSSPYFDLIFQARLQ